MNKINLIKLGAILQKKFDLKSGFDVVEFPSDSSKTVKIAIPMSFTTAPFPHSEYFSGYDEIEFSEKIGTMSIAEQVWVGYGKKSNTVIIKEIKINT
jgi:hypothetical protein